MILIFDKKLEDMLCCPHCKSDLLLEDELFICRECGLEFIQQSVNTGEHLEHVYDFRISRPDYCIPKNIKQWQDSQRKFEYYAENIGATDNIQEYINEIDSVKEIYTDEYNISGKILDVGGEQGRLRHFLNRSDFYVNIDVYANAFSGLYKKNNLLAAYPSLKEPCYFLLANAEYLPFKSNLFDWTHMRSTLDHFEDPFKAVLEAYRVSKPGGRLMIGLSIIEKLGLETTNDEHVFRFTYSQILDLMKSTGWSVEKEHWQKPPYGFCLYIVGKK